MNPISRKDQLLQMIENEPEQVFLHYALAKEFEKELNWIEASKNYQLILQIDANYIGVYYHYGKLLEHLGQIDEAKTIYQTCLLYTSPSPRDRTRSRMPSSA